MTRDEKPAHDGWSNYETWAVNLWLTNEEGVYRYWTGRTRELIAEYADEDADRSALARLAEELKESVHEECVVPKANLAADLMTAALGEVDWCEIARSWIDDETPPAPKVSSENHDTSQSRPPEATPEPTPPNADGTREEWTAFTEQCIDQFLDLVTDRTLYGYGLVSDAARVTRYERQLAQAADQIGQAEVEAAYDRVEARWREKLGERLWTAVLTDHPALAEEAFRAEASVDAV